MEKTVKILAAITFLLGLHVLISSSILLYFVHNYNSERIMAFNQTAEKKIKMSAASLGIIFSILQSVISAALLVKPRAFVRIWMGILAICCLITLICFILGVHGTSIHNSYYDHFKMGSETLTKHYFSYFYHNFLALSGILIFMITSQDDLDF